MIIDKSEIQAKGMWKTFMKEIFNNDSCFNQLMISIKISPSFRVFLINHRYVWQVIYLLI